MKTVSPLLVFGTRPEAIKMAPIVLACARRPAELRPIICLTGQHREMLDDVMAYFGLRADIDLAVMTPGQSLAELTSRLLTGLDETLARTAPDCVVAQGDTTTVFVAALAAFYRGMPLVHVEAGLRTGNVMAPWPEEFNRRAASLTAAVHCATERAAGALLAEGIPAKRIHMTGNTVVDALLLAVARERVADSSWRAKHSYLGDQPLVLITGHRRENFGAGLRDLCQAIARLAVEFPGVQFIYPVHLNPNVQTPVRQALADLPNVRLPPPAPYGEFVWLMDRATLIVTDSGGIQEEAPSLGKPVLVTRETTERPEALATGLIELVGTSVETIIERGRARLTNPVPTSAQAPAANPYGDGHAAERIVDLIARQAWKL